MYCRHRETNATTILQRKLPKLSVCPRLCFCWMKLGRGCWGGFTVYTWQCGYRGTLCTPYSNRGTTYTNHPLKMEEQIRQKCIFPSPRLQERTASCTSVLSTGSQGVQSSTTSDPSTSSRTSGPGTGSCAALLFSATSNNLYIYI